MVKTRDSLFLSLNFADGKAPDKTGLAPPWKTIKGAGVRIWKNPRPGAVVKESLLRQPVIPIDINHSTYLAAPEGRPSPTAGWIIGMSVGENGAICAGIDRTEADKAALERGEHGFISPVFKKTADGGITHILRAVLAGNPNLQPGALNSENGPGGQQPEDIKLCRI